MIDTLRIISANAGEKILEFYDEEISVERKDDNSPLTKADMAAHHYIVDSLTREFPDTPVISEESGIPDISERKKWKRFWLVDPLDGTKEFIKKNGEFTVNIALIENGVPLIGVVHIPAQKKTYWGSSKGGSFKVNKNGKVQQIFSRHPDLQHSVTIVSSRSHGSGELDETLTKYGIKVKEKIPAGSSLKFCLVADGTADIYPRMGPTMEWDTAAGDAVYRYSGRMKQRYSPLVYNKANLKNGPFIIGLESELDMQAE